MVIALFSALLAPYFIDWSQYKRDFEVEAGRITGQEVRVGRVEQLRLLPLPSVTFAEIEIGETHDGEPMMTADRFSITAELMPFLRGEVRIVDLGMRGPVLRVDLDEQGGLRWNPNQKPALSLDQIALQKMTVDNGSMIISGLAPDREILAENFDAVMSARSLLGPWSADGTTTLDGRNVNFSATTGTYQSDGSIRSQIFASFDGFPYRLAVDGLVSSVEEKLTWNGEFLARPLMEDEIETGASQPLPVTLEGKFEANSNQISILEYRGEIGSIIDPYVVQGDGQITLGTKPEFKVKVDGNQLDLSRLSPTVPADENDNEAPKAGTPSIADRIIGIRTLVSGIPVPRIPGEFDLVLPAVTSNNTLIREVSAKIYPIGGSWGVRSLRATLPGNTSVEAGGRIGTGEDFGFSGQLLVATRQPSGFSAWATGKVDPAVRRLNNAGFSADVTLSENQTTFDNLVLVLDDAKMTGQVQQLTGADGRSAIVARLNGETVDFDNLRAIQALALGRGEAATQSFDLDLSVRAQRVRGKYEGLPIEAQDVDSKIRLESGALSVDRLNVGNFQDVAFSSTGRIQDLLGRPSGNIKLAVRALSLQKLASFALSAGASGPVIDAFAKSKDLSSDTDLEIEIDSSRSGEGSKGQALATGTIGGSKISSRLGFDGVFAAPETMRIDANLSAENTLPHILVGQLGIAAYPNGAAGPMKANLEVVGTGKDGLSTLISVGLPGTNATAQGLVSTKSAAGLETEFKLTLGSENLAPYLGMIGAGSSLLDQDAPLAVSGSFELAGSQKQLSVSEISILANGSRIAGNLAMAEEITGRRKWQGKLALSELSLPWAILTLLGNTVDANPNQPDRIGELFDEHDLTLEVSAETVSSNALPEARALSAELTVVRGSKSLNQLALEWLGGALTGNLAISGRDGPSFIKSQFQWNGVDARQLLSMAGLPGFMDGKVSINGVFDGVGRTRAAIANSLNGSGIITSQEVSISGLQPDALSQMLLIADVGGFEINQETISEVIEESALEGTVAVGAISEAFTLSNGAVRLRNFNLGDQKVKLGGDAQFHLPTGEVEADLKVDFEPGIEAVAGAVPQFGLAFSGKAGQLKRELKTDGMEGYFSIRAFEREQRRVEIIQAGILEKQRLRRSILFVNAQKAQRARELEAIELEKQRQRERAERLAKEQAEREAARQEELRRAEEARQAAEEANRTTEEKSLRERIEDALRLQQEQPAN